MRVTIYLESQVRAFSVTDPLVESLKRAYPAWSFTRVISSDDFIKNLLSTDIAITWKFKPEWYKLAPSLKAIFTPAAGAEWVHFDPNSGIPVFHGHFHGPLMAESLCGMIHFFNRSFHVAIQNQRVKRWDRNFQSELTTLSSQVVVIIGFGTIGAACAKLLKSFGCRIIGLRRNPELSSQFRGYAEIYSSSKLLEFLPLANHVVTILPANDSTKNLLTKETFSAMEKRPFFYNIGRGNCYSESDLEWALRENKISGAGLDVFNEEPLPPQSPLWDFPNVLITPHSSAIYTEYLTYYFEEIATELRVFQS